jgi:hypothetical protein
MTISKQSIEAQSQSLVEQIRDVITVAQALFNEGILDKEKFNSVRQQAEDGYPTFAAFELARALAKQTLASESPNDRLLLVTNQAA